MFPDVTALPDFCIAARRILGYLRTRLNYQSWFVARLTPTAWTVIEADTRAGDECPITPGFTLPPADTLCARVVAGEGSLVAPDLRDFPAYADTPVLGRVRVRACLVFPIRGRGGAVFGTLCAFDPDPAPPEVQYERPLLELLASLLGTLADLDTSLLEQFAEMDQAVADQCRDALTGLHNRRGWDVLATAESQRTRAAGAAASVLSIDLDGLKRVNDTRGHAAGDAYIRKAAEVLRAACRPGDIVARFGGDEFVALLGECGEPGAAAFAARVEAGCAAAGVGMSIGAVEIQAGETLDAALSRADQAMYAVKRTRPHHRAKVCL